LKRITTVPRGCGYEDAIQEALRFGWIDSVVRPMDEERYKHRFSPRKKGSTWSESNKARVKRLMDEGLMTPAGTAKIEEAKADGSWDLLRRLEGEGLPADLAAALEANPQAKKNFETYTPSARKMYLWWLADAKRPETRVGRIAKVVEMAMNGEDLVGYMRKK